MISECVVTMMEILNKLCAVCLSFSSEFLVLSVKLQISNKGSQTWEIQMIILSLIYRPDVKHLR